MDKEIKEYIDEQNDFTRNYFNTRIANSIYTKIADIFLPMVEKYIEKTIYNAVRKESLKQLALEFPEYYAQIENK